VLDDGVLGLGGTRMRQFGGDSVLGLVPDESMKAWLLVEVESSNSMQFNQSILFPKVNSEPPENPGFHPIVQTGTVPTCLSHKRSMTVWSTGRSWDRWIRTRCLRIKEQELGSVSTAEVMSW